MKKMMRKIGIYAGHYQEYNSWLRENNIVEDPIVRSNIFYINGTNALIGRSNCSVITYGTYTERGDIGVIFDTIKVQCVPIWENLNINLQRLAFGLWFTNASAEHRANPGIYRIWLKTYAQYDYRTNHTGACVGKTNICQRCLAEDLVLEVLRINRICLDSRED